MSFSCNPSAFAWGCNVPSVHGEPRGGCFRVLSMERLYTPAGENCALGSLFTAISYLVDTAESEIMKQKLHTTYNTTTLGVSHRPGYHTPCNIFKLMGYPCFFDVITTSRSCWSHPRLNYRPAGQDDNTMYHAVLSQ